MTPIAELPIPARNGPCPCGSGRKYKQCCGSLAETRRPELVPSPARASVQSLMQRALQSQLDADFETARSLYLEALEEAPAEPDILHMLGMTEYCLHAPEAAIGHFRKAMALATGVSGMRHNLRIVEAAAECRRLRHLVFDPDVDVRSPAAVPNTIHLLNTYGNPAGGGEWHTIELGERLNRHCEVQYWTEYPHPSAVFDRWGVRRIDVANRTFPQTGTLVVAGCFFPVGAWLSETRFRRVIVLYNVFDPIQLCSHLKQLAMPNLPKLEILYASDLLRRNAGLPGRFEPSPIDLEQLQPGTGRDRGGSDFVVGRLSRDEHMKFHPDAARFFRELAASGIKVRIMGGTLLGDAMAGAENVELLPVRTEDVAPFLHSLDCFTYRTHPSWTEAWGRVVTEAMAVGLPVVVHANAGYAQIIEHGRNGFLFHSDREALGLIARLRNEPALRSTLGRQARRTIVDLVGDEAFARHIDFYLQ